MLQSQGRAWLTGAALSGMLLAGNILAPVPSHAATGPSAAVSVKVAIAAQASMTQVLRRDLHWRTPLPTTKTGEAQTAVVAQATEPAEPKARPQAPDRKPVQVAEAAKAKPAATPVSRGNGSSSTLIDHALSLQGIPYVFGGMSRSGFDCSGFTKYVFAGSGITLPRTSYEQFNAGSAVSRDQLQPGDLVFFTTYAQGPSHVGIYIGGGRFVHASTSGVRTTSLADSYYAARYVGARRVR